MHNRSHRSLVAIMHYYLLVFVAQEAVGMANWEFLQGNNQVVSLACSHCRVS